MTLNKQWRNNYGVYNFNNSDNRVLGKYIYPYKNLYGI